MNILLGILKYPPDYAGDGLRLHRSMQRWIQKGAVNKAYVLTSWDETSSKDVTALDGIRILRPVECTCKSKFEGAHRWFKAVMVPFQSLGLIFSYFRVSGQIDLVLTSGSGWLPSLIGWLAVFTGKPLVKESVLLGSDDPMSILKNKSRRTRWFFLFPFRHAKLIITISPPLEKSCLSFGIPKERIWSRFNPIEMTRSPFLGPVHPAVETDLPVILWVGTVSERKNLDFLMHAAAELPVPARVVFVGPCPDKRYFEKLKALQTLVPPHVEIYFLNLIEDQQVLAGLYAKAKLFWFASKKEGMGNVVAEALMSGTPVVTLPVMGIMKEVIPCEEDGEVVDTDNPLIFALAAARWLCKDTDRAATAHRAARRFSPEKIDELYRLYFQQALRLHPKLQTNDRKVKWPAPAPVTVGS